MWSPSGYLSWNDVLGRLFEHSRQILSLAALGGDLPKDSSRQRTFPHTAEYYLNSRGFAEGYAEAELIVGITTSLLLVRLLEDYPPVLVSLNGNAIHAEEAVFCHRDQLECCYFDWPITKRAEFYAFFKYHKEGGFDTASLLDRFAFIDCYTGEVRQRNGAEHYLLNGLGLHPATAARVISFVKEVTGYVVCWSEFPEGKELRDFLSMLEANDDFTKAINLLYGPPSNETVSTSEGWQKTGGTARKKGGRPSMREEVARVYWTIFPDGHAAQGKSWKDALAFVNRERRFPVSEDTLRRAVSPAQ